MEESEYESVLCVKPEVHVYRIPPRATNRGYRASEWQLDQPSWSGRLRITAKGKVAYIKLEDRTSGELFAQAPVDQFPGTAVESVTDSSRYFVIRIEDGNGRRAFIGIGFGDRGDAFDFNVALQDHFKWVKQQCEFAKQAQNPDEGPKLDLGFKEGQTIKINIANMRKKEGAAGAPRTRPASAGGLSLLPPPPGGKMSTLIPPSGEQFSGGSLVQPVSGSGPPPASLSQALAGSSFDLRNLFLSRLLGRSCVTLAHGRRQIVLPGWPQAPCLAVLTA
ncbi:adaptin ear-binding coat-associated protein 2 isoform 1 [Rattus norvegicus]|uniref:NECAP endocytosis associated 2 n=1 Tax=Rattus norvegicus TaxID=10116 RepID=A0A8L2UIC7_RAT|nr:adaptin ear-binding coat-associated protein 2 isoform 1 [Rattus norvegicus]